MLIDHGSNAQEFAPTHSLIFIDNIFTHGDNEAPTRP
jgi:hypothetical protein